MVGRFLDFSIEQRMEESKKAPINAIDFSLPSFRIKAMTTFLYVLAALLVLYLAFFFYVLVSLLSFQGKLNSRLLAFSVLLREKKDLLSSLYSLLSEKGVEIDSATKESCAKVGWLLISSLKENEVRSVSNVISAFQKRMTLLISQNETLSKDEEVTSLLSALMDIDGNYRRIVASYNAEIIGYEYWRKMWLYSWLFFLFGFRKRNRFA